MKFHMGPGLMVDLEVLVDTRLLVQANSGGGKSHAIRRLLEQTHGRVQHHLLDPEGEFGSLRERFDYVYAAKAGGDTAADPRTARLLAERVLEIGCSIILDLYELRPHERVAFVRHYLEALVDAPKALWHPALVVLDEAHVYCPQSGDAESAGAVKDLSTRGRKRGFCAVLATQRLAKLHKDAAAECNNKLIGRTGLDVDRARAADELGLPKSDSLQLRELAPGDFLAYGPAFSVVSVGRIRVGPVATTHPKAGARLASVVPPPPERVKALLPRLADLPAAVEKKQKTEAELRAEIQRLQAELRARPEAKVERVEVEVVSAEALDALGGKVGLLRQCVENLAATATGVERMKEDLDRLAHDLAAAMTRTIRSKEAPPRGGAVRVNPAHSSFSMPAPTLGQVGEEIPAGSQKILDGAAWLQSIGVERLLEVAVAFLSGYNPRGGAYLRARGWLTKRDYLRKEGEALVLTAAGKARAAEPAAVLEEDDLHRSVLARLPNGSARLLSVLIKHYPSAMGDDRLGDACDPPYNPDGGAYLRARGRLSSLGLIDRQLGLNRAAALLFPCRQAPAGWTA